MRPHPWLLVMSDGIKNYVSSDQLLDFYDNRCDDNILKRVCDAATFNDSMDDLSIAALVLD